MTQLLDTQMTNIAEYDCFSQVVFESLEHYKSMKEDPFYRKHRDHENFADVERSGSASLTANIPSRDLSGRLMLTYVQNDNWLDRRMGKQRRCSKRLRIPLSPGSS